MDLKTLARQHDEFAARQARKAAKAAVKTEKARRWTLTQETWRKRREARDRTADLRQQAMLDSTDAERWPRSA